MDNIFVHDLLCSLQYGLHKGVHSPNNSGMCLYYDDQLLLSCLSHRVKGSNATYRQLGSVTYSEILLGGGSTNSVEDKGQKERGSGGGTP